MDVNKLLPLLKTGKPSDIFKKIVLFNSKADRQQRAIVRIGLGSGFMVEGTPIKIDEAGNVIFTASDQSISYINSNSISGIQVLNPKVLLEVLTDGSYFEVDESNVPTSLELKRNLKNLEDFLKDNYGISVESDALENSIDSDAEKFQFGEFLNILQNSIQNVADDSLGKEALKTLSGMNITVSENKLEVKKIGNANLSLGVNFKNKFADGFKTDLQAALESNL